MSRVENVGVSFNGYQINNIIPYAFKSLHVPKLNQDVLIAQSRFINKVHKTIVLKKSQRKSDILCRMYEFNAI